MFVGAGRLKWPLLLQTVTFTHIVLNVKNMDDGICWWRQILSYLFANQETSRYCQSMCEVVDAVGQEVEVSTCLTCIKQDATVTLRTPPLVSPNRGAMVTSNGIISHLKQPWVDSFSCGSTSNLSVCTDMNHSGNLLTFSLDELKCKLHVRRRQRGLKVTW